MTEMTSSAASETDRARKRGTGRSAAASSPAAPAVAPARLASAASAAAVTRRISSAPPPPGMWTSTSTTPGREEEGQPGVLPLKVYGAGATTGGGGGVERRLPAGGHQGRAGVGEGGVAHEDGVEPHAVAVLDVVELAAQPRGHRPGAVLAV